MFNGTDGIILIDKNEGETSFDVVKMAKRVFKTKAGHAGTLDPFATGLLIILLGQGTKLSSYLMAGKKKYLATMTLGIETDTLDRTGRVLVEMPVPDMPREEVARIVREFTGDIEQRPPAYSAVNYKGQRAYKLARKGIEVDLGKRKVVIHSIEVVSVSLPDITFEVT
ncbi:MAG: tRNA pseudouridine(55) synthase TruB, partial [Deltaproteobacteria bacterium]|nr:tRNA pseudouridine(55) synthase TruB [Deltaproteobacteria bacterium]